MSILTDEERRILKSTWRDINARCGDLSYHRYGGRGISVYSEWVQSKENPNGFNNFLHWVMGPDGIGPRPNDKHPSGRPMYSVDRINNDGNYEPGNLRWATSKEQTNNSTVAKKTEYNGIIYPSMAMLDEEMGFKRWVISRRINKQNMTAVEAIETPVRDTSFIYNDITYPGLTALSKEVKISDDSIRARMNRGMCLEEAAETPLLDRSITHEGITYRSLAHLCEEHGLNYNIIHKQISNGLTLDQAIKRKAPDHSVTYNGTTYPSLTVMCKELNLNYGLISDRIRRGA